MHIFVLLLAAIVGCAAQTTPTQTLVDYLNSSIPFNVSIYKQLAAQTGVLGDMMAFRGTIIMPTDEAFQSFGKSLGSTWELLAKDATLVSELMRYHTLPGFITPENIAAITNNYAESPELPTLLGAETKMIIHATPEPTQNVLTVVFKGQASGASFVRNITYVGNPTSPLPQAVLYVVDQILMHSAIKVNPPSSQEVISNDTGKKIVAIVLGVCGGMAGLALLIMLVLKIKEKRRTQRAALDRWLTGSPVPGEARNMPDWIPIDVTRSGNVDGRPIVGGNAGVNNTV